MKNRTKPKPLFRAALQSDGTLKLLKPLFRAALQSDGTLELLVYEDIGVDWWTGEGITAKTVKQQIDTAGLFTKIAVRINSPGGDAFEGVAIYNLLRAQGKPIAVFVDGIAASAASVIAMAGDTRVMGSGAMLMIHNAWSSCVGYAEDMRKMADTLDKVSTSVAECYIQRAGLTADKAKELMDAESWLSASASLELGLATGIAEPEPEEANAALALARSFASLARLKAVPEILKQRDNDEEEPEEAPEQEPEPPEKPEPDEAPLAIFETELRLLELTLRT